MKGMFVMSSQNVFILYYDPKKSDSGYFEMVGRCGKISIKLGDVFCSAYSHIFQDKQPEEEDFEYIRSFLLPKKWFLQLHTQN